MTFICTKVFSFAVTESNAHSNKFVYLYLKYVQLLSRLILGSYKYFPTVFNDHFAVLTHPNECLDGNTSLGRTVAVTSTI